jgi:hypothetical protein
MKLWFGSHSYISKTDVVHQIRLYTGNNAHISFHISSAFRLPSLGWWLVEDISGNVFVIPHLVQNYACLKLYNHSPPHILMACSFSIRTTFFLIYLAEETKIMQHNINWSDILHFPGQSIQGSLNSIFGMVCVPYFKCWWMLTIIDF